MRTPDSDQSDSGGDPDGGGAEGSSSSADPGSLAEGFTTADSGDGAGSDDAFGTGWGSDQDPDDESYAVGDQDPTSDPTSTGDDPLASIEGDELSAFEFDTDYVPDTDTDWDITGDGVVDGSDLHEAATSVQDFHVDGNDAHDHAHHHDGGFFDG